MEIVQELKSIKSSKIVAISKTTYRGAVVKLESIPFDPTFPITREQVLQYFNEADKGILNTTNAPIRLTPYFLHRNPETGMVIGANECTFDTKCLDNLIL